MKLRELKKCELNAITSRNNVEEERELRPIVPLTNRKTKSHKMGKRKARELAAYEERLDALEDLVADLL